MYLDVRPEFDLCWCCFSPVPLSSEVLMWICFCRNIVWKRAQGRDNELKPVSYRHQRVLIAERCVCLVAMYETRCILTHGMEVTRLKQCFFQERGDVHSKQAGSLPIRASHSGKPSLLTEHKYHIFMTKDLPAEVGLWKSSLFQMV